MKFTSSLIVITLIISPLSISSVYAANNDHSSYQKIDVELKNAWSELDRLKPSKHIISAKVSIKNALVASYTAQGKELKGRWIEKASLTELSQAINHQKLHHQKDFLYPAYYGNTVEKLTNKYKFSVQTACNNRHSYLIQKNLAPSLYELCEKQLSHISQDGEPHSVPKAFPLDKILKSEFREKYSIPFKTQK